VTPIAPERTISEAAYHVLTVAQREYPDRKRIHLATLADDCHLTYSAMYTHLRRLVSAGVAVREAKAGRKGWYWVYPAQKQEQAERKGDPGAVGEGEPIFAIHAGKTDIAHAHTIV